MYLAPTLECMPRTHVLQDASPNGAKHAALAVDDVPRLQQQPMGPADVCRAAGICAWQPGGGHAEQSFAVEHAVGTVLDSTWLCCLMFNFLHSCFHAKAGDTCWLVVLFAHSAALIASDVVGADANGYQD